MGYFYFFLSRKCSQPWKIISAVEIRRIFIQYIYSSKILSWRLIGEQLSFRFALLNKQIKNRQTKNHCKSSIQSRRYVKMEFHYWLLSPIFPRWLEKATDQNRSYCMVLCWKLEFPTLYTLYKLAILKDIKALSEKSLASTYIFMTYVFGIVNSDKNNSNKQSNIITYLIHNDYLFVI